jgi:LemA protein
MWVFLAITFALGLTFLVFYNRFVRLRQHCKNAWADVDVQLKRRHDLIPNLVEVVKGYAAHERDTLLRVTEARAGALAHTDDGPAARAAAEARLTQAIQGMRIRVEAYPDLQASASFRDLQQSLTDVEDHLQNARRYYNATVREFNTAVEQFPGLLVAGPLGFAPREFFEAAGEDRAAPAVAL